MRKGIYLLIILTFVFFLSSCRGQEEEKSEIKFQNLEQVEEGTYKGYVDGNSFNISDYIICDEDYQIICGEEEYSSSDIQVLKMDKTYLSLVIVYGDTSYKVKFYQNHKVTSWFLFPNGESLSYELLVGSSYNNDLNNAITNKANELGYSYNGYVNYEFEEEEYENVLLSELLVLDDIIFTPCLTPYENKVTVDGNEYIIITGEVINYPFVEKDGYVLLPSENGFKNGEKYFKTMGDTFTSLYKPNVYKVTYKYLDQEEVVQQTFDEVINLLEVKLEGYTLEGWYYNDELFSSERYSIAKDITLTAKLIPNKYTLKFTNIDEPYEVEVSYNEKFTLPVPVKEGFTFKCWSYNGEEFIGGTWKYLEDIEVVATWTEKVPDVSVNLEAFGGSVEPYASVDGAGNLVLPTPTKEGYSFVGWYFDTKLTNKVSSIKESEYNNEVLYAKYAYTESETKGEFVVTKLNAHAGDYSELAMFDSTKSGFTSKYWHKIALVENEHGYVVSKIAISGESLSSLGEYDYVILAYTSYQNYNAFVNLDIMAGYHAYFTVIPSDLSDGDVTLQVSFVAPNIEDDVDEIKEELSILYDDIDTVSEDINLIKSVKNYNLIWKSSNINAIANDGTYTKPHVTRNVTLEAYVGETKVYEFSFVVKGENETSTALSTGYIYTPYTITQNAMDMLDIIYTAFLEIDYQGNWTNLERMKSNLNLYILPKAKLSGTKVVVSINQKSSGNFSNVCKDATLRTKLVDNIIAFMLEMNLDGVDIDWETPSESEKENFTLLMKELYEKVKAIDEDLLVTAAIGGGKWAPPCYDLPNSKNYMDYINLMTYSMAKSNGYYQNSLYKSTKGATLVSCSIQESIDIYNDLGVENTQIIVGIPFYCTKQTESGGPGSKTGTGKSVSYSVMLDEYPLSDTMKEYFDEECGVPYRYDPTTKIMFSYDNERSIKLKCDYINTLGLAGIMYWQYGQDVDDMLTNAIKEYINK